HLNRICNEVRGKSALSIIQEHLIEQAKTYLLHTSYSVSEIAYLLNFEYPNYFARLFKKLNGVSPREFRNKQ
ncbi:helix-turn-helix domain-containing protein, partial [Acinetobacter baumannii]